MAGMYIGIDPGTSGAIAWGPAGSPPQVWKPDNFKPKGKTGEPNQPAMAEFLVGLMVKAVEQNCQARVIGNMIADLGTQGPEAFKSILLSALQAGALAGMHAMIERSYPFRPPTPHPAIAELAQMRLCAQELARKILAPGSGVADDSPLVNAAQNCMNAVATVGDPKFREQRFAVPTLIRMNEAWCSILSAYRVPWRSVMPITWQKSVLGGAGGERKVQAIAHVARQYPTVSLLRPPKCRKPDDNMADAVCIWEYCVRHFAAAEGEAEAVAPEKPIEPVEPVESAKPVEPGQWMTPMSEPYEGPGNG